MYAHLYIYVSISIYLSSPNKLDIDILQMMNYGIIRRCVPVHFYSYPTSPAGDPTETTSKHNVDSSN